MDKLELAWQTYEFYTNEILVEEEKHVNNIRTLKNFVDANPFPTRHQKSRMKKKCLQTCTTLNQLYNKQSEAISDLIKMHNEYVDIPSDREVDISSLLALKNVTATLMQEIHKYKSQIEEILS
jgi:hypothetical protein